MGTCVLYVFLEVVKCFQIPKVLYAKLYEIICILSTTIKKKQKQNKTKTKKPRTTGTTEQEKSE